MSEQIPQNRLSIDNPIVKRLSITEAFQKCFPVGSQFDDRYILSQQIETLAAFYNFKTVKSSKSSIQCNCNSARLSRSKGIRSPSITYKVGCSFKIHIIGINKIGGSYLLQNGDPCVITKNSNYNHT